jgi:hypothetical protein
MSEHEPRPVLPDKTAIREVRSSSRIKNEHSRPASRLWGSAAVRPQGKKATYIEQPARRDVGALVRYLALRLPPE